MARVLMFDTLKFANRLKKAGIPAEHAEAEAGALAEVLEANMKEFATKEDVQQVANDVRKDMQIMEQRTVSALSRNVGLMLSATIVVLGILHNLHIFFGLR